MYLNLPQKNFRKSNKKNWKKTEVINLPNRKHSGARIFTILLRVKAGFYVDQFQVIEDTLKSSVRRPQVPSLALSQAADTAKTSEAFLRVENNFSLKTCLAGFYFF